ncbi:DAK2 domain-containing protein [Nocardioides sp. WG-D5]
MSALDTAATRAWLLRFADRVIADADDLTELDRLAGDGDFGWNTSAALRRARPALESAGAAVPSALWAALSDSFLAAGGTSGPLFGLWFGRLGAADVPVWTARDLAEGVARATEAVTRLGGASAGDCTMVDAMIPAVGALARSAERPWAEALAAAAVAAAEGAASTGAMVPSRGRASYVGERAREVVDPGALAVAWFFEAGSDS